MCRRETRDVSLKYLSHAEIRCEQRYGEKIGHVGVLEVKRLLGGKHSQYIRTSDGAELWDVFYRNQIMRVVFDPRTKRLVTFLPPQRRGYNVPARQLTLREKVRALWSLFVEEFLPHAEPEEKAHPRKAR